MSAATIPLTTGDTTPLAPPPSPVVVAALEHVAALRAQAEAESADVIAAAHAALGW